MLNLIIGDVASYSILKKQNVLHKAQQNYSVLRSVGFQPDGQTFKHIQPTTFSRFQVMSPSLFRSWSFITIPKVIRCLVLNLSEKQFDRKLAVSSATRLAAPPGIPCAKTCRRNNFFLQQYHMQHHFINVKYLRNISFYLLLHRSK